MKTKRIKLVVLSSILTLVSWATYAAPTSVGLVDVIGKLFVTDSGSSITNYLMSASIKTVSRQNIEIGFLYAAVAHVSTDVQFFQDDIKNSVSFVMVNCKEQMYAPYPTDATNVSFKIYQEGKIYKWGDYENGKLFHISNYDDGYSKLTNFFKKACQYTDQ